MAKSLWPLLVLVTACDLGGVYDDAYWDNTQDDDGTDPVTTAAGVEKKVAIDAGRTTDAEQIKLLPVGQSEGGATKKVALEIKPPKLAKGDRLITPAEVQVTTRCDIGQNAPGCNYNPNVRAQLILTGNPGDTSPGGNSRVIATQTVSCTKDEHHCMFVFRPAEATITVPALPCVAQDSCVVNLVLWAWSGSARSGGQDEVLVGGNDMSFLDNHQVEGDVARLMAVRERGIGVADRQMRESSGNGSFDVNTNANPEVVYSHKLKDGDLVPGEKFVIEAHVEAETAGRARFSTQLFVAHSPNATDGSLDKIAPGSISEQNGTNCHGACVARKVAVFEVTEPISGPVYVNVVAKSEVPGGGSTRVTVKRDQGWVRSVRYAASIAP